MTKFDTSVDGILAGIEAGDRRSIARAITAVENDTRHSTQLIDALHKKSGNAFLLGLTGPPGAGKSTLVAALVKELRAREKRVAVIAIDPTSPYSGGALLGDRVRMQRVAEDEDVFIRSMATRGSLGGLSRKTVDAITVLDAAGFEFILIETVGVGQSEVEIASAADTTVVTLSPEAGDGIQAMKAGLMEIADIFVVNKSDREGSDRMVREIKNAAALPSYSRERKWFPTVFKTQARMGTGVSELLDGVLEHKKFLESEELLVASRKDYAKQRLIRVATDMVEAAVTQRLSDQLESLATEIVDRNSTTYSAASKLLELIANDIAKNQ